MKNLLTIRASNHIIVPHNDHVDRAAHLEGRWKEKGYLKIALP